MVPDLSGVSGSQPWNTVADVLDFLGIPHGQLVVTLLPAVDDFELHRTLVWWYWSAGLRCGGRVLFPRERPPTTVELRRLVAAVEIERFS